MACSNRFFTGKIEMDFKKYRGISCSCIGQKTKATRLIWIAIEYAGRDGASRPQQWCTRNAQMVHTCRVNGARKKVSV